MGGTARPGFRAVALAVILVLVAGMLPAPFAQAQSGGRPGAPVFVEAGVRGPSIVSTAPGVDPAAVAARYGIDTGIVVQNVTTAFSADLSDADVAALQQDADVLSIFADREVAITAYPTQVERTGANTSSVARVGAGGNHSNRGIAIIDTGATGADLNIAGGANFVSSTTTGCVNSGSYADDNGHGTHVAGIAAARDQGNGTGPTGIAPNARIYAVKVLTASGRGSTSAVICGLEWVYNNRANINVANLSLGGAGATGPACSEGGASAFRLAICRLVDAGVPVVVAAGNSAVAASSFTPGGFTEAITVGSFSDTNGRPGGGGVGCSVNGVVTADDQYSKFSNYGSPIDIIAPGGCITSLSPGGGTSVRSGTSMAAPAVAAGIALYGSVGAISQSATGPVGIIGGQPGGYNAPVMYIGSGSFGSTLPSASPSVSRSASPSVSRSASPSVSRSASPSVRASASPSVSRPASASPSVTVTPRPTRPPRTPTSTVAPSRTPTVTVTPSRSPSASVAPSRTPTVTVTVTPSRSPSATVQPSRTPTATATTVPSSRPTRPPRITSTTANQATAVSRASATATATEVPVEVSASPSSEVTETPQTTVPEVTETPAASVRPGRSARPNAAPTVAVTDVEAPEAPTEVPTEVPTEIPTEVVTEEPTVVPTEVPTEVVTEEPVVIPTEVPVEVVTEEPTVVPTEEPTIPVSLVSDTLGQGTAWYTVDGLDETSWYMEVPAPVVEAPVEVPLDGTPAAAVPEVPAVEPEQPALEFDLGYVQTVGSVSWLWDAADNATYGHGLEIQVSLDGETWTTVAWPDTWNVIPGERQVAELWVDARYVRFMFPDPQGLQVVGGIAEVAIRPVPQP